MNLRWMMVKGREVTSLYDDDDLGAKPTHRRAVENFGLEDIHAADLVIAINLVTTETTVVKSRWGATGTVLT